MSSGTGPIYTPAASKAKGLSFTGYAVQDTVDVLTYREELNTAKQVPYESQNEIMALIQSVYGRGAITLLYNGGGTTLAAGPVSIAGYYTKDATTGNPTFGAVVADAESDPANAILLASLAVGATGYGYQGGTFTSALDTRGANIGDTVWIAAGGGLTLDDPSEDSDAVFVQVVGIVQTLALLGVISGILMPARFVVLPIEEESAVY